MAPRRRAAAAQAAPSPPPAPQPLAGCVIAISGKNEMPDSIAESLDKKILALGGVLVMSVTKTCTHVVAHRTHYEKTKSLCRAAKAKGVPMVSVDWIIEAETNGSSVKVDDFFWENIMQEEDAALLAQQMGQPVATKKRPIAVANPNGAANGGDDTDKKPKTKKAKTAPKKAKAEVEDEEEDKKDIDVDASGETEQVADGQFLKKKDAVIPVDTFCTLYGYQVYIDDSGLIYDASLNQTNASHNNNKFYIVQLLAHPGLKDFKTWTRWGRVGESGANAVLGDGDLASAMKQFEKKFKDKSGLSWQNRNEPAKPGKYSFVEKSYDQDSDDEDGDEKEDVKKEEEDDYKPPVCTLAPPVQGLMEMIFNQQFFQATMANLNYDAKKLPLGKLSKATILKAFEKLKDLAALLKDPTLAASRWNETTPVAIEHLSNAYYSLIPHDFGRNRPLIINNDDLLKKELELLESLSDMKVATDLMKADKKADHDPVHALDRRFQGLGLDEMTALDHKSSEFDLLEKYLNSTRGSTHNRTYKVIEIFRIERAGERNRFNDSQFSKVASDRRLLWHGSRCTNFGGILSQGLRIAPPEAPVSGYMFGKGIYLADMSSKSANYCASYLSNNEGLLLLCEAELGNPMQELYDSDYDAGDRAKAGGKYTTKGLGRAAPRVWMDAGAVHGGLKGVQMPDPAHTPTREDVPKNSTQSYYCLEYNEYICYDVDQVQLKYLFRVKM